MHQLLFWPLAGLGLLAVRLPYLLSPNRLLDGDEAVLGLMAKHTAALSELPLFYWGQAYGFSLPETMAAALAFRVFGMSSLALSLSMLFLFLVGLWLFEGGFRNLAGGREWSRTFALVLGLLPVWVVWGFKARGGYLTAFVLSGLILKLVTSEAFGRKRAVVTGFAAGLLFFAQPLWFATFAPLLILPLLPGRGRIPEDPLARPQMENPDSGETLDLRRVGWVERTRLGGIMALAALVAAAPIAIASFGVASYWVPEVLGGFSTHRLLLIPEALFTVFTGFFYLGESWTPPLVVWAAAMSCLMACVVTMLALGFQLIRGRDGWSGLLALSLLASVAVAFLLNELPARYLLQSTAALVSASAAWIGGRRIPFSTVHRIGAGIVLAVLIVAAVSVVGFRPLHPTTGNDLEAEISELVQVLGEEGVEGVFSMDALLQWQVLFYGNEEIPARFASPVDRRPEYPEAVDAALAGRERVALVGTMLQAEPILGTSLGDAIRPVGENYFVLPDPSRSFLEGIGFRFTPDF
jgi:hypothetical protein